MINKTTKDFEQKEINEKRETFEDFTKDFKDISIAILPVIILENILTIIGISEGIIFGIYMFVGVLFSAMPTFLAFGLIQKYKNNYIRKGLLSYAFIVSILGIFIGYQASMFNINNVIEACIK